MDPTIYLGQFVSPINLSRQLCVVNLPSNSRPCRKNAATVVGASVGASVVVVVVLLVVVVAVSVVGAAVVVAVASCIASTIAETKSTFFK